VRSIPVSNPQSPIPNPSRRGITIIEVLVSIAILMLGMLGVAALIPIGKLAMIETNKSDRTGMCGRAGLREIKVRRMLDSTVWDPAPANFASPFIIDPLGRDKGLPATIGPLRRMKLTNVVVPEDVFLWHDDLTYVQARDSTNPTNGERPAAMFIQPDGSAKTAPVTDTQAIGGDFSWFVTVSRQVVQDASGNPFVTPQFSVAVVVCWKRNFTVTGGIPEGEQTCALVNGGLGIGGGTVELQAPLDTNPDHPVNKLKDDRWVMLVGMDNSGTPVPIAAQWYRVVGVNRDLTDPNQPVSMVSLVGPDWAANPAIATVNMVVVEGVTGVYTTPVQLDDDATWTR
jgi:hypothetical protein